ncbi:MAG: TonB-dependent receptor [Caulobacteraceae bacterium]|nr:TonB-dependent receptor [Caulobacteraceae bacterium]
MYYDHDDGYVRNVYLNSETSQTFAQAYRGKLMWKPNDTTSVIIEGNYSFSGDSAPFANHVPDGMAALSYQLHTAGVTLPSNPYEVSLTQNPALSNRSYGISLHGKTAFLGGTLTDIASVEFVKPYISVDVDNTSIAQNYAYIRDPETTETEELDFASPKYGFFSFVTGAYIYWDTSKLQLTVTDGIPGAPVLANISGYVKTDAQAVFAETNFDLTSKLRLVAGARYSMEGKLASAGYGTENNFNCVTTTMSGVIHFCDLSKHWDSFTPRVILQYKPDADQLIYASYSQGFKSGDYNVAALTTKPVNPETVDSYELGYKYGGRRFTLNTAAYYYSYKNIQVQAADVVGGAIETLWENAAQATIYGLDAEFAGHLDEHWQVNLGFEWTHARYGNFPGAQAYAPFWQTMGSVGGTACTPFSAGCYFAGENTELLNAKGKFIQRTPEYSGDFGVTYTHPLPVGSVNANLTASYKSNYFFDAANQTANPSYWLVNTKVSWISPTGRYTVSAWGKNITNSLYYLWGQVDQTGPQNDVAPPASGGIMVEAKF